MMDRSIAGSISESATPSHVPAGLRKTRLRRIGNLVWREVGHGTMNNTRILIVEDDPDNLETLGLLFTTWGYDVLLAETGEEAIGRATATPPHIVLLDLGLPGIHGEEVAKILKAGAAPPFIVAYTGYERLEAAAVAAGCDAFLVKPSLDKLAALLVSLDVQSLSKEVP